MRGRLIGWLVLGFVAVGAAGAVLYLTANPAGNNSYITFRDDAQSNVSFEDNAATEIGELAFTNVEGDPVRLDKFLGKKNIVLVVTRGYSGQICLYCATHTSRLITRYDEFAKRNAEVVVVFPVNTLEDRSRRQDFFEATNKRLSASVKEPPFPVLLDVELKAVDELGLRAELAKPATYILDRQGRVRFAYVGVTIADRPSMEALLKQLDAINGSAG